MTASTQTMDQNGADSGNKIIRKPHMPLFNLELPRAISEMAMLGLATPMLSMTPKGDGHPVIVAPGFMAGDSSTGTLRRFLKSRGYDVYGWDLGTNLGPKTSGLDGRHLGRKVMEVSEATGKKTSLIGWSLGGVMCREMAKYLPNHVRQVITLGSPILGKPETSNIHWLYQLISGHKPDAEEYAHLEQTLHNPPELVPSTAIFSRTDGVVAWQTCREARADNTDNIEVHGSHSGLGFNASVYYALADRLSVPEGQWTPFEADTALRRLMFPSSGHDS